MASFGWMIAILSLIFDANASAGGQRSRGCRPKAQTSHSIVISGLSEIREIGSLSDVSAGHHIPLGHRDDHRGHRHPIHAAMALESMRRLSYLEADRATRAQLAMLPPMVKASR